MNLEKLIFLVVLLSLLSSCAVSIAVQNPKPKSPIVKDYEPFRVFTPEEAVNADEFEVLGDFSFKDPGMAMDCGYSKILAMTIEKARSMGGNGIKIVNHKKPSASSTCDEINGKILYSAVMWKHEKEITWHQERKLQVRDFKGANDDKQFTAGTYSGFKFEFIYNPLKRKIDFDVNTFFDTQESFFGADPTDSIIMRNQQLHFDTSELYSRIFIKRMLEECKTVEQVQAKYQSIYNEVQGDLLDKQNDIMAKAYQSRVAQKNFIREVAENLVKYQAYSDDKYVIML